MNNQNVFYELIERFKRPWSTLSFKLYFFIVIVFFGGMGVIVSIIEAIKNNNESNNIPSNLMTYSIALLVPACITIFLHYFPNAKNKVSLVILCIFVLVITSLMAFYNNYFTSIFCLLLAWIFWTIANSDNIYLDDNAYDKTIKKDLDEHGHNWD